MLNEDKNIGGSLVLDLRIWWRHVKTLYSRRRYSIFVCFIYGLEENNSKSEVIFAVCRLPLTSYLTSLMFLNVVIVLGKFSSL